MAFNTRKFVLTFLVIYFPALSFSQSSKLINKTITPQYISSQINFLASDSLLGRNTPSEGLEMAANYIANEFKTYGLEPINGSFFL